MDLSEKEKYGLEKDGEGHLNYHSSGIPTDWRYGNPPPAGLVPANSSMSVCPPVSMGDSFCPTLWDHPSNSSSLGFAATGGSANNVPVVKPVPGSSRLDMPWNPSDPLSKAGGMFSHPALGVLPHGMPQFPPDSDFIERAAKFSCFGGGNFPGIMNTFGAYPSGPGEMAVSRSQSHSQKSEGNVMESSKELVGGASAGGQRSNVASPMNSQRDTGNSHVHMETGETEFSGSGQEEAPLSKALAARKRKKNSQEMEIDQAKEEPNQPVDAGKEAGTARPKDEPNNSPLGSGKHNGKNAKDATEPGKEDYIHVRARRGQATNSHSLAERVRREKISERMKFLQDLVPGCSKVTGKAVMLDEIINYVQSLQRQVEFLSMKLASVNPQIDFNIEGLLSKELLQSRAGASSTLGFTPDMVHPFLHSTSQGLVQPGNSSMGAPSDALRRAINAQLSAMNPYKEAKHQIHNTWDDELHNVISQMGLGTNLPLNIQDSNDKPRDGFPM